MSLKLHYAITAGFLALILSIPAAGQAPSFAWATQFGGTTLDLPRTISSDASGNVYSGGKFSGTVTFNSSTSTTLTALGANDAFITKHDALGNFIWVRSFGDLIDDEITTLTTDASGNIYIAGIFGGTVDFDPGPGVFTLSTSNMVNDAFVLKLDPAGNFVWAAAVYGTNLEIPGSIAVDGSGAVYVAGRFSGTTDFDPSASVAALTSAGQSDVFVWKLNPTGTYAWAVTMGSTQNDAGIRLALDQASNIYVTGHFRSTANFNTTGGTTSITSSGSDDVFICKLDGSGGLMWVKGVGGTGGDIVTSIGLDAEGNIYTSGTFSGNGDFDPGPGVAPVSGTGSYISKLDAAGDYVWVRTIALGMGGLIQTKSMTVSPWGSINLAGIFAGTGDFDPGAGTQTVSSGFGGTTPSLYVSSLSSNGDLHWIVTMGSTDPNVALIPASIYADATGGIYTIGNYNGTGADLDPGAGVYALPHVGDEDVFIIKLGVNPLPIKFGELAGRRVANFSRLNWSTYTEQDNEGFHVERSGDGTNFEKIGFVPTKAAQGRSKEQLDYTYEDISAVSGVVYYRLRASNADGSKWYSNVVQVSASKVQAVTQIVPNPATDKIYIIRESGRGSANINILNIAGQVVHTVSGEEVADISVDISSLTPGSYFVNITDASGTEQLILIKQ